MRPEPGRRAYKSGIPWAKFDNKFYHSPQRYEAMCKVAQTMADKYGYTVCVTRLAPGHGCLVNIVNEHPDIRSSIIKPERKS